VIRDITHAQCPHMSGRVWHDREVDDIVGGYRESVVRPLIDREVELGDGKLRPLQELLLPEGARKRPGDHHGHADQDLTAHRLPVLERAQPLLLRGCGPQRAPIDALGGSIARDQIGAGRCRRVWTW